MFSRPRIQHCNRCGHAVQYRLPPDDNAERACCPACGHIQYENPLNVVGTLPRLADGRVLLCRRAIEPRKGYWTLPAGFMELGETVEQGALRETAEEAGVDIELGPLISLLSVIHVGQVHLFFAAHARSDRLAPGPETLEARWFAPADIPWEALAFRTVRRTLEHALAHPQAGLLIDHIA